MKRNRRDAEAQRISEYTLSENLCASAPRRLRFWRSLDEFASDPEFEKWLHREFPPLASEWTDEISRRRFLKLMGASFALAGLSACTKQPIEKIVPYVKQPEQIIPGKPLFFASAHTLGGYARGIIVESHEGRPTKIEGNPAHPASLGATDVFMQASVLDLYDPDRSQTVLNGGAISTWDNFLAMLNGESQKQSQSGGAGLRILTGAVTSPTLGDQIQALLAKFPNAKWHQWEPVNRDNVLESAKLAFGQSVETIYHFDKADVVVSLGADFLGVGPAQLRHARDFTNRRRIAEGVQNFNRLYVAETTPTITGAMADHRVPVQPSVIRQFAEAFASALQVTSKQLERIYDSGFVSTAADDLKAHRGASIFIAGDEQPARVHYLAHLINAALGNIGKTITYTAPVEVNPVNKLQSLRELATDMSAGKVELLLILGGNPMFDAPADFEFAQRLTRVKTRVHFGTHVNETATLCEWHVPAAHELESWSDARAFDGTTSLIQPLIEPLYGGKTAHEIVAAMLGAANSSSYEIVRAFWQKQNVWPDFEASWRAALRDGVIPNTASPELAIPNVINPSATPMEIPATETSNVSKLEIIFRPDPNVYDGCFANNAWLQELPKPITKLTWDNAALISPKTAERLHLEKGDVVELTHKQRMLRAPVFIMPGHADDAVTLHLGYGRKAGGHVIAAVAGFDAYSLRASDAIDATGGIQLRKTGEHYPLVTTQQHFNVEGRNLLRVATLGEFAKNPGVIREMGKEPARDETLYRPEEHPYKNYAWAMAIDLSTCIGCNTCVIACMAENNIPVVGKEEVARGREMQWIRVDTYFEGAPENPAMHFQPLPCMHCENAPCELVCPVAATVHDSDGLNLQVYNRCIGTRYCSNNCPYKVRRFNFLEYDANQFQRARSLKLQRNPNVSVRSRGVMEKCTYCIQRIEAARIESEKENRRIRDGEIIPACAQACPTEAIIFGDLNDAHSRVVRYKKSPLNYGMLDELNTRPRTTYLARVINPNPEAQHT